MKEILPKDYHLKIVHNAGDTSAIIQQGDGVPVETEIAFFEKQIMAIHHRLISKGYLPSLDAIRRAAEEIDGMFALGQFSADIPEFLQVRSSSGRGVRSPEYGERRVLAVEAVFCEMGLVTREALQQTLEGVDTAVAVQGSQVLAHPKTAQETRQATAQEIVYTPRINMEAYPGPSYGVGDWVRVATCSKPGHVRVPGYLLGKVGKIVHFQGMFLNPEAVAHFKETVVRLPLYLVEFELAVVWGEACPGRCKGDKMRVEIYEPWLTWRAEADV